MANRYWVGNGGNWSDSKHWADVSGGRAISNSVVNGDFLSGTTGWSQVGTTGFTASGGIASFTATAQNGRIQRSFAVGATTDIIYYFARVKTTSNLVGLALGNSLLKAHSGSGNYEFLSWRRTAVLSPSYSGVIDTRASAWNLVQVDYVGAINLTALFGLGNEPTIEYMDGILANIGYIDGTIYGGFSKPTSADDVILDANSFSLASQSLTLDEIGYCNALDVSDVINEPTIAGSLPLYITAEYISGDITLVAPLWITPKDDWTAIDYYNFDDLNRVEINTDFIDYLLSTFGGSQTPIGVNKNRDNTRIEFYDSVNRIENNIELLKAASYQPVGWIAVKTDWVSLEVFDNSDANRLERNLLLLYQLITNIIDNMPYCGTFYTGEEVI